MKEAPAISLCPRCEMPLASADVDGLCARCLGSLNFDAFTTDHGTGNHQVSPPSSVEELAPFFPQFEIHSCLGQGGMGVVYKARQKSLDRWVALKLLSPERAADPAFAQRFVSEARTLAALSHPHIVGIHDFGEAGGMFYLLMEYVEGENLRQVLKSKRLTPAEALAIVAPVCDALQCAHELGIVHRDIKPENLLIHRSGTVKIADFGIARMMDQESIAGETSGLLRSGTQAFTMATGTPDYAAPEQLAMALIDRRADIYSLGVVLYEMLTGERPGTNSVTSPSRRAKVDPQIDEIVLKALAKEPERRFDSVVEFRSRIQRAQSALARKHRWPRPAFLWISATLVIAALSLIAWAGWEGLSGKHRNISTPSSVPFTDPDKGKSLAQRWEGNFNALMEARKQALMQTPNGGSVPEHLAAEVARLEARDQMLRELILSTDTPPNQIFPEMFESPPQTSDDP